MFLSGHHIQYPERGKRIPRKPQLAASGEEGFILVASLIFLVLLVVLGVSAIKTTTIELQIAGNDKVATQNFYQAEGAAKENLQALENAASKDLRIHNLAGLTDTATILPGKTLNPTTDLSTQLTTGNFYATSALNTLERPTRFMAIDNGISGDASLSMTESQVHVYYSYGYATKNNGTSIILIGYKKRW